MTPYSSRAAAAALAVLVFLSPAAAAGPVFARESYWHGFADFWLGAVRRQSGVVMTALVVAAVSIFIITRGKWKK